MAMAPAEEDEILLPEATGVTARNAFFEVMADDMLSAQYVAMVGEILVRRFSRMLPLPAGGSQPVLVTLVSPAKHEMQSAFLTRIHDSGQVTLAIAWREETTRDFVERALAQAHLTYLSGAYSAGTVHVPLWLELAGQHLARVQAIPAHGHFLSTRVAESGPMRLESILTAQRGEGNDAELGPHAYWLLTFLERDGRRGQLQNFLIRLLRGEEGAPALAATYGEQLRSSGEAQLWWLVGVKELLRAPSSPMPSADRSRGRIQELGRFRFESEGREIRLFAEDLWEYRASASLQDELRHRVTVTRMEIASVHPYYHNVLLSLERLFQAVLAADEEAYREALVAVRHDLRTGDELMEDTRSVLDDLAAELEARNL